MFSTSNVTNTFLHSQNAVLNILQSILTTQSTRIFEKRNRYLVGKISRKLKNVHLFSNKDLNKMKHQDILGSSETTREPPFYSFHFDNYKQYHQPQQKAHLTSHASCQRLTEVEVSANAKYFQFLEWFIGFAEGDGTFSMRQEDGRFRFLFEVGQKDPKILYKIKKTLGFGRVSFFVRENARTGKKTEYWRYSVDNKRGLQRIMSIFNGNIVLPKRRTQFEDWVCKAKRFHSIDFFFDPRPVSPSLTTGWISGFIEAEGCFYANFTNPSIRSMVAVLPAFAVPAKAEKCIFGAPHGSAKMHLVQKCSSATQSNATQSCKARIVSKRLVQKVTITQQDVCGEKKILKEISDLFGSQAKISLAKSAPKDIYQAPIEGKPGDRFNSYRIEISSLKSHEKVIDYLQAFPLQGDKHIAFDRWRRVYWARLEGEHLDQARLPKLKRLCLSINKGIVTLPE